jgi:hypothetical protein
MNFQLIRVVCQVIQYSALFPNKSYLKLEMKYFSLENCTYKSVTCF